jgi:hypothetical protein
MSFALERSAIEGRFSANWSGTSADRVRYENVKFTIPTSGSWVSLKIVNGGARVAGISANNPLNRYQGLIIVDVFVPEDTGTETARGLADSAASIFRNVQFSSGASGTITTRVPTITPVGIVEGWYQLSMSVGYHRDKVD